MKLFNFKKISAIATSVLMVGMTMGIAAAASFPAPYSSSTSSGVAIVSGTGAGVDDTTAVNSINDYLKTQVKSTGGVPTGGKLIEKGNEKINLGDGIWTAWGDSSPFLKTHLPTILGGGTFTNADNNEYKYTEKIELANFSFAHIQDSSLNNRDPTLGFQIDNNGHIANYTLSFTTKPQSAVGTTLADFENREITILGKDYFILDFNNNTAEIILLDSASTVTLDQGESTTITLEGKTHDVSVSSIGSDSSVIFVVDGKSTNALTKGQSQRVGTDAYIGVKSVVYQGEQGGIKRTEFTLGSGKLELKDSALVKMNDKNVDGLYSYIDLGYSGSKRIWNSLVLTWKANRRSFLTENTDLTMPGFEAIKLSMAETTFPKTETTLIESTEDYVQIKTTVSDGEVTIPILYKQGSTYFNITGIGEDARQKLATSNTTHLVFNHTNDEHNRFVASWVSGRDYESYYLKVSTSKDTPSDGQNSTTISSDVDGSTIECTAYQDEQMCTIGNHYITINEVLDDSSHMVVNMTLSSGGSFNTLYTKEGLKIYLPYDYVAGDPTLKGDIALSNPIAPAGANNKTFTLWFAEADKNGDLAQEHFNVTVGIEGDTTYKMSITGLGGFSTTSGYQTKSGSKLYEAYVYSELATKAMWDKTTDNQNDVTLTYHGSEVHANVYLAEGSSGSTEVGTMVFKDTDTGWRSRDVILVGGSCINSATAEALDVTFPTCEADFTAATGGVGQNQYLVQSVGDAFTSGKIALIVAGYAKADTAAAASKLVNEPGAFDTTAGNKYLGVVAVTGTSHVSSFD